MPEISKNISQTRDLKSGYKKLCLRLGIMMIVIFVSRGISTILLALLDPSLNDLGETGAYLVQTAFSLVFLYFIPMIAAALLLKTNVREMNRNIYKKPKYFGSALGMFPAFYSLAILMNLLTMWITSFFKDSNFNDNFNTVNELSAPNLACGIVLFIQMVVIAPLFEEFWFRGMVMESMRPYGNGVAIFISAFLFGLTHANFAQFFYAMLMGIFLGYIAVSTRSIVTTTIIHAIFNSLSATLLLLLTDESVKEFLILSQKGIIGEFTPAVTAYFVMTAIMLLTAAVGLIMAIFKLVKIKKYKVPVVQTELSAGKRWTIFFTSATVLIGLVLAADCFTVRFIPTQLYKLLNNAFRVMGGILL